MKNTIHNTSAHKNFQRNWSQAVKKQIIIFYLDERCRVFRYAMVTVFAHIQAKQTDHSLKM